MKRDYVFPFVAITGQEKAKRALLLNLINPRIGGVLLSGEKGTAKSTMVRGMAALSKRVKVINLPLNITEDRLVGSIDIEQTLVQGKRNFEPGILKEAHENILYVDEINLLSEHIVNCLLEVASSGINRVEREGISFTHPSRFVIVGTMNPEEGYLRSQLLDRFGLFVEVKGCTEVLERKEIIKRRLEYEKSPSDFTRKWKIELDVLLQQIKDAKQYLKRVRVTDSAMRLAVQIAREANCQGHRAELVIIETAKAIAAYERIDNITMEHLKEAAEYALPHRKREKPLEQEHLQESLGADEQKNDNSQQYEQSKQLENQESIQQENPSSMESEQQKNKKSEDESGKDYNNISDDVSADKTDDIGKTFFVRNLDIRIMDRRKRKGEGKRIKTKTDTKKGRYTRYKIPKNKLQDIAFDATLRAAAPYQKIRDKNGLAVIIKSCDFREKVREKRTGSTIVFIVDASGSMGAKKRMSAVKGAVVSLLADAYQKRDKVGLVAFRKKEAEVLLNITRSVDMAKNA